MRACDIVFDMPEAEAARFQNPYLEVTFQAEFRSPKYRTFLMPGFWDGGRRYIIRITPVEPGEWIYEPFSGSGTTLIAAETTSRRCAALELDPRYVDVALRRWQDISGKSALLEATGATFEDTAKARGKHAERKESH